jgi:hypothetical protein
MKEKNRMRRLVNTPQVICVSDPSEFCAPVSFLNWPPSKEFMETLKQGIMQA